jgi:hypothetical protein
MYQFASAAYAATARLALAGTELQADVLFASARRIRELLECWPAQDSDVEAVLDHAARVWSIILGDVLEDPDMPAAGQETAARLAHAVFPALQAAAATPDREALLNLLRITYRYAQALRQASEDQGVATKPTLFQKLRTPTSRQARGSFQTSAMVESIKQPSRIGA